MSTAQTDRPQYPTPALTVSVVQHGATVTISLRGELDIATQTAARDAIDEALARQCRHVVLDLSRLAFMDSTGVHLALTARGLATAHGVDLIVTPGPPAVQRMFDFARAAGADAPAD